jgi:capsular polysaccharide biosynthesis protein
MDALKKTLFLLGMSNRALRIIFLLAVVSTVLMFATQYFWVKNAYNLEKNYLVHKSRLR